MCGWLSLSLQDILTILKPVDIIVPSEYSVYVAVQNWVLSQIDCPPETVAELLSLVEFKNMDFSELERVEKSDIASSTQSAAETVRSGVKGHLYDAFRYHASKEGSWNHVQNAQTVQRQVRKETV